MNSRKYSSKLWPAVRSMSAELILLSSVLTESHAYRMSRWRFHLYGFCYAYFFFCFLSFKAFHGNSILVVVLTLLASWQIHPTVSSNSVYVNRRQLVGKNSHQSKRCSSNLTVISSQKNRGPILILMSALTAENVSVTYSISDGKNHFSIFIQALL